MKTKREVYTRLAIEPEVRFLSPGADQNKAMDLFKYGACRLNLSANRF